jgi:hypothetical protein
MDKYDKWFQVLADRLRNGERFGLRMNLEGEGKFKDFQGEKEIPALKQLLEKARKDHIEEITVRDEHAEQNVISEF